MSWECWCAPNTFTGQTDQPGSRASCAGCFRLRSDAIDRETAFASLSVALETRIVQLAKDPVAVNDPVNHPKHYNFGRIEVIEAIDVWGLGFALGNVVKYIARAKHKGSELDDLSKARWYLNHEIERLEKLAAAPATKDNESQKT